MLTQTPLRMRLRPALLAVLVLLTVSVFALQPGAALAAAPTEVSAVVTPDAVDYPDSAVVSGTISAPGAGLTLLARPAGAEDWSPVDANTAGLDGAFSFTIAPPVTTDYRVAFDGDDAREAAVADVILRVRSRVTTTFPSSLWLGGAVLLRGAVAPAHPDATVSIERRVSGIWRPLTTVTLNADSRFAQPWMPETYGFLHLRARLDAHEDHDAGLSTSERVIVNRPNAHRVPYRYAHYIVIVRHEYRLYYYEHGALVRAFDVALGRPGYSTPLGAYSIYGRRKPAGGALGSCAMYYRRQGGIAIHGTNEPWLIRRRAPRAFSHGCARMLNNQVLWLYERCPNGTPVHNLR
jgi:lipoprotein-anchoring transpeptidase ErfK/SrfK